MRSRYKLTGWLVLTHGTKIWFEAAGAVSRYRTATKPLLSHGIQVLGWQMSESRVKRSKQIFLASPVREGEKNQKEEKRSGPYSTSGFERAGVHVTRKNRDKFINTTVRVMVSSFVIFISFYYSALNSLLRNIPIDQAC